MGKLFGIALLGFFGWGAYEFVTSKKSLANTLGVVSINSTGFTPGLLSTELDFDVTVNNPSAGDLTITSFNANIIYNNITIGTVNDTQKVVISPMSKSTFHIKVVLSNTSLLANAPSLISSSLNGIKILLDGYINSSLGSFPFTNATTLF